MATSTKELTVNDERQLEISHGLATYIAGKGTEKFSDFHVSEEPELKDIALEYLGNYSGTLDFMNDLKGRAPNLSLAQIRGVLNVAISAVRERGGRVPPQPINGLALRGYYIMPNNGPTIVIRKWRDDGTSVIGYEDPISKKVEAFGSISPGGAEFSLWGRYSRNEAIKIIADDFLIQADSGERTNMQATYAAVTNKCAHCGENPNVAGAKYCNQCVEKMYGEPIPEEEPGY
jgi:hypothetical protein